ncbi:MAG: hypothetical protein AAGC44_00485 [Planctomycetota bacterium]
MPQGQTDRPEYLRDDTPIDQDLFCAGCSYNLRGLSPLGRCPECGVPIADSLDARMLPGASHAWIQRVRMGAILGALACFNTVALPFFGCALAVFSMNSTSGREPITAYIFLLALIGLLVLAGFAAWQLTSTDPSASDQYDRPALTQVCRWTLILCLPLLGLPLIVNLILGLAWSVSWPWVGLVSFWSVIFGLASLATGLWSLNLLIRSLAQRLGDRSLARSCKLLAGFQAVSFMVLVISLLASLYRIGPAGGWASNLGCVVCALPVSLLVAGIWQMVVLNMVSDRLDKALPHRLRRRQVQREPAVQKG